jgi:uncharacterized membrane protein
LRVAAIFAAGLASLVITPPFQSPDGLSHLFRAEQLSTGRLLPEKEGARTGGRVPAALAKDAGAFGDLPFHPERHLTLPEWRARVRASGSLRDEAREFAFFPITGLYAPVPYLPQAAAFALSRLLGLTDVAAVYLAAFCALIACSLVLLAAFRALDFSPRWTNVAFVVAGMPMSFFLLGSPSADGMVIALSTLCFALALRLRWKDEPRTFAALLSTAFLLGLCKGLYLVVPTIAAPLAFPGLLREQRSAARACLLIGCGLLPALIWALATRGLYVNLNPDPGIDVSAQLRHMLDHPLRVAGIFLRTLVDERRYYVITFVGQLGWADTTIPRVIVNAYVWLLLAAAAVGNPMQREPLDLRDRAWMLLGIAAFVLAVLVYTYLTWMPVGSEELTGVQGRYFIPLAPLLLATVPRILPAGGRAWSAVISVAWLVSTAGAVNALLHRYWA